MKTMISIVTVVFFVLISGIVIFSIGMGGGNVGYSKEVPTVANFNVSSSEISQARLDKLLLEFAAKWQLGIYMSPLKGNADKGLYAQIGTKTSVAVTNASLTSQNIAVAPGGVILGKIQTEGKLDLASIRVSVYGASADGVIEEVASMQTNSTGDYSLEVPYGTYFLLANGAVSDGIGISAGAATYQKNLTQFSLLGQVSKNLGNTTAGANAASVLIGAQSATTNSLGVFTFNVMEGKNWICAVPSATNDPTYGYTCNLNVLVDASTVAAARQ